MKAKDKVHKVMTEYKEGTLRSGSAKGPKVTSRKQAIAIAMSEAGMEKKKKGRGRNPFFGNALPYQLGQGDRWFSDDRPKGPGRI